MFGKKTYQYNYWFELYRFRYKAPSVLLSKTLRSVFVITIIMPYRITLPPDELLPIPPELPE